jgi:hypothetical protein
MDLYYQLGLMTPERRCHAPQRFDLHALNVYFYAVYTFFAMTDTRPEPIQRSQKERLWNCRAESCAVDHSSHDRKPAAREFLAGAECQWDNGQLWDLVDISHSRDAAGSRNHWLEGEDPALSAD